MEIFTCKVNSLNKCGMTQKGFTLAEVLITLGIIGVVSAMTIPTLINNINNKQYEVALKKVYSELSQARTRMADENGGTLIGLFNSTESYVNQFKNYMKDVKVCTDAFTAGECWHAANQWYDLNGAAKSGTESQARTLITTNGAIILFDPIDTNAYTCTSSVEVTSAISCGRMRLDVNGFKGPNKVAKDIFDFYILNDRIIPRGHSLTTASSGTCPTNQWSCALHVLSQGMDY